MAVETGPDVTELDRRVSRTLDRGVGRAVEDLERLAVAGINLAQITSELEAEGVESFARSYRDSLDALGSVVVGSRH